MLGTQARIFGNVFANDTSVIEEAIPVVIAIGEIREEGNPSESYVATQANNGSYTVTTSLPPQPGYYHLNATAAGTQFYNIGNSTVTIELQELFLTRTFVILYIGGAVGFGGLVFVILKAPSKQKEEEIQKRKEEFNERLKEYALLKARREDGQPLNFFEAFKIRAEPHFNIPFFSRPFAPHTYEILRFLFLSTIAFTPLLAFALTDVQIAPASPFGLVIRGGGGNNTLFDNQWVVNIGGIGTNEYENGIQVPVSVVIFGLAGGYLRFLYYTSTRRQEEVIEEESFYESIKDLALFFLSPLLAIAVWLVLFQGGTTSTFTLAAVSFTVGLVTREVVYSLIGFVKSRISPNTSGDEVRKATIPSTPIDEGKQNKETKTPT